MDKIGIQRISIGKSKQKKRTCLNCGAVGEFHVTFRDYWGTLKVVLCRECAGKKYEELALQHTFSTNMIV